jgi:hypothetical protein
MTCVIHDRSWIHLLGWGWIRLLGKGTLNSKLKMNLYEVCEISSVLKYDMIIETR